MRNQIMVDADALRAVLEAFNGPTHLIRELLATRGSVFDKTNPVSILIGDYNAAIARAKEAEESERITDVVNKKEYPMGEVDVIGVPGLSSCLLSRPLPVGTKLFGPPTFSESTYHSADGTLMHKQ